ADHCVAADVFGVLVALGVRDACARCADRRKSRLLKNSCACRVPRIREEQSASLVQLPKAHRARRQSGCHDPHSCQCSRNSVLKSFQRSSGKKIRAPSSSTRRRVPGMVAASHFDHSTSKYTSSVPHTISVGACSAFSLASTLTV